MAAPERARSIGVVAAIALVVLVSAIGAVRLSRYVFGPSCRGIPVALANGPAADTPIAADDVLLFELQGPGDLDFSDPYPELIVTDQGEVIALDGDDAQARGAYRRATLAAATLDPLRGCVQGAEFQSLGFTYPGCDTGVNEMIAEGPPGRSSKRVRAKFHPMFDNTRCNALPPESLVALKTTLDAIQATVATSGRPTAPPAKELAEA